MPDLAVQSQKRASTPVTPLGDPLADPLADPLSDTLSDPLTAAPVQVSANAPVQLEAADYAAPVFNYQSSGFGSVVGVESGPFRDYVDAAEGQKQRGTKLTPEERLFVACEYMIGKGECTYEDAATNVANIFFGFNEVVERVQYSPSGGVTVFFHGGYPPYSVGPFVPFAGQNTNRRAFFVDAADDAYHIEGSKTQLAFGDSVQSDASSFLTVGVRNALWTQFLASLPQGSTAERDDPRFQQLLAKTGTDHIVLVKANVWGQWGANWQQLAASARTNQNLADSLLRLVMTAVAGAVVTGVYKTFNNPNTMTVEDEVMVADLMATLGFPDVSIDVDNLLNCRVNGIVAAPAGPAPGAKAAPTPGSLDRLVAHLNQLKGDTNKDDSDYYLGAGLWFYKGLAPADRTVVESLWGCDWVSQDDDRKIDPKHLGAWTTFMEAWVALERAKASGASALEVEQASAEFQAALDAVK